MKLGHYHEYFDSLPIDAKPNQKFLKFLSISEGKNKSKRFINLELLCNMDKNGYPGLFSSAMANFNSVIDLRDSEGKDGTPTTISWEKALENFYLGREYDGVTSENEDIAKLYKSKGVSQEGFDEAVYLRRTALRRKVPEHILGTELKEETILESIETTEEKTTKELKSGKEMIEELYAKKFTYAWLSKKAAINGILGLFVDCCGTITSSYYGSDIARASILAKDVQNLVIRDYEGKIISKGTIYVNEEDGYAVINDFELNRKYRKNETDVAGIYDDEYDSKDEENRELIFQAYMRGIHAFIEEYNKQHPNKRIKQINIGTTYNRLKRQKERFEFATQNLTVPTEYNFRDAEYEQYILYKEDEQLEEEVENGDIEK